MLGPKGGAVMTDKQSEMWAALEAYQSTADADGHGDSWRVMLAERTEDAARAARRAAPQGSVAWDAAEEAQAVAWGVAWEAECAAVAAKAAAEAALAAEYADEYAQEAILTLKEGRS